MMNYAENKFRFKMLYKRIVTLNQLSVISYQLSVISYKLLVVRFARGSLQLSVISYQLSPFTGHSQLLLLTR